MQAEGSPEHPVEELSVELQGTCGIVTIKRPRALNALTTEMRAKLAEAYPRFARDAQTYCVLVQSACEKAFSVGGDVREITSWGRDDRARARRALKDEYALNWLHECFSKPTISLIDGPVMGSGVGISLYGTHRVAGERYRFAMPETAIGLFPDVGVAWPLSRMPNSIGMYLGLTGRSIGPADAFALGLLTHCIPAARFPEIKAALVDTWPVDTVLDERHVDPGPGELEPYSALIDRCFSAASVETIVQRLEDVTGGERAWAQSVAAELKTRAPLSLKVTHRHIRGARSLDLRETLAVDYRLARSFLDGSDFYEGVRAALIDKDGAPNWLPATLNDVTPAMVDAYFAPVGEDELILPTRRDMQSARV
jgi:enoyl-CoA hydratase